MHVSLLLSFPTIHLTLHNLQISSHTHHELLISSHAYHTYISQRLNPRSIIICHAKVFSHQAHTTQHTLQHTHTTRITHTHTAHTHLTLSAHTHTHVPYPFLSLFLSINMHEGSRTPIKSVGRKRKEGVEEEQHNS